MVTVGVLAASIGYWHALSDRRGWPAEAVPLPLCATIINVLYLGGLLGVLRPAAYLIVAGGVVALIVQAPRIVQSLEDPRLSPGLVVAIIGFAWLAWKLHDAMFVSWDVFSHWGLVTKEISSTHALVGRDSTVLFKDYPPGAALFHYFISLGAGFSESRTLISQALLICASAAALLIYRSAWISLAVLGFIYFAVFAFVALGFQNLGVDHLLSLFFGCGLGSYYLSRDGDGVWRLLPVAFALPLLKDAGLLLAVFLVLAVALDQLLFVGRKVWGRVVVLAVIPFVASMTWKSHVSALDAGRTFKLNVSVSEVTRALSTTQSSADERVTIERFKQAMHEQPVGSSAVSEGDFWVHWWTLHQWAWFFAGLVVMLCAIHRRTGDMRRLLLGVTMLCALAAAFVVGLLVMYLFSFGQYEGTRLASYGRYMGTIVFGIGTVLFSWALAGIGRDRWAERLSLLVIGTMVITMASLTPPDAYRFFRVGPTSVTPLRGQVQRLTRPVVRSTPPNARIYVVAFGSKGLAGYMARYELAPRRVNKGCFDIGSRRFPGDVWTCAMTVEQMRDVLRDYDFVLLGSVDEVFWREFGSLFAGRRDSTLFEVDKSGLIQLVAR